MLNINKLLKNNEIRVFHENGKNYVCINGHALYRQELWPDTECVTEPPPSIRNLLREHNFIDAAKFPHIFSLDNQSVSLYAGESADGEIIVKLFDADYTNPVGKRVSISFGGSNEHKPLYVLDSDSIDAIIMPWKVNWNHPVYGFVKRSVEDWYTKGIDAVSGFKSELQSVLENLAADARE